MGRSRVVKIHGRKVATSEGGFLNSLLAEMMRRGLSLLGGAVDPAATLRNLFGPSDRIGIKVNTIGGRKISTRPEVALALAGCLTSAGSPERNILIWDRTNRELREAGYRLADARDSLKVYGTDTAGAGYETEIVSHLNIGSLLSTLQTQFVTGSISLAILKDHGLAGVTASLKNYFGTIHNPNKYHDRHCDPYVAELFDVESVKNKHRLSIIDALVVQYHRGPSYHPQWADPSGVLIFGTDPVAVDVVGWRLLEQLRAGHGLPSLREEGREPTYLATAQAMGLGRAAPEGIEIVEDEL